MSSIEPFIPAAFTVGALVRVAVATTPHTGRTGIIASIYYASGVYKYTVRFDEGGDSAIFFGFELSLI